MLLKSSYLSPLCASARAPISARRLSTTASVRIDAEDLGGFRRQPYGDRPRNDRSDRERGGSGFGGGDRGTFRPRPSFEGGDRPARQSWTDRPTRTFLPRGSDGDRPPRTFDGERQSFGRGGSGGFDRGAGRGGNGGGGGYNSRSPPRTITPRLNNRPNLHLLTLADLTPGQIISLLENALATKLAAKNFAPYAIRQSMNSQTIALLFSKRSTRTRVASETALTVLGGRAMFLGASDIQLGVNETLRDSAQVIGSMADGFFARVGAHSEIEELAAHSPVPVINALSYLWHPTQILADLLTIYEAYAPAIDLTAGGEYQSGKILNGVRNRVRDVATIAETLRGKKVAWIGDMNNISWELMATCPRLGMEMSVATPAGYDKVDDAVMARLKEHGIDQSIHFTNSPKEALHNADIVVTDTWISMGMEAEKEARLKAFSGYQVTNELVESAGAKPDWKFMHCLPRKQEEVDDEVFYGPRSLVFPEAENRKWTTIATFE